MACGLPPGTADHSRLPVPCVPEAALSMMPTLPPDAATSATSPNAAVLRNLMSDRLLHPPPPGDHAHDGVPQVEDGFE
ncbi:hypothetical protein GCM10009838_53610 [Catenulispora subtropica]|uniref:Uncharacterized protein n=2 Tax=Catenulispora subtropica TaxID=450798 RepID=A0ABP5DUF0_9ACTN